MAKPSKLSPQQWEEVKRKHIVDEIPIRQLAKEYGVNEKTIRLNFAQSNSANPQQTPQSSANAKERIEQTAAIAIEAAKSVNSDPVEVGIALELAVKLETVRGNLSRAASNTSSVADIMSVLAKRSADKLAQDKSGMIDIEEVKQVGALIELTNRASYIGLESVKINKEAPDKERVIKIVNSPDE